MNSITIGQYYPADSLIHRMDPRVKITGAFLLLIGAFLIESVPGLIFSLLFLGVITALSKVPFRHMIRSLRGIVVILAIAVIFNIFMVPGNAILTLGALTVTDAGLIKAGYMFFRLTYIVAGTSLMTYTTTPVRLTEGLERIFAPLSLIKVPVREIAMIMSIALRFIPVLGEEAQKIKTAQMSRGADFESGNILVRAKSMVPVLVPLFVSAFRRADELSIAMESRCYDPSAKRGSMKPLRFGLRDGLAFLCLGAYMGIMVTIRVLI